MAINNQEMAGDPIPQDLRDFILRHIRSVADLEALLLLRSTARESWRTDEIAQRLYIPPEMGADILKNFHTQGLLVQSTPKTYRYEPKSEDLAELVDRVAVTYAKRLIAVTTLIHGNAGSAVRSFADAFRVRKSD